LKRLRIAFVHPNLGLGGAERLVVDAARSLEAKGHQTTIFTARYDPDDAFEETRELDVRVVETRMPDSIAGRVRGPANVLRMARVAGKLARYRGDYDVAVCDLTAHIVPQLKRALEAPVAVYCHYPDTLLTERSRRGLYALYRKPMDSTERSGMKAADAVMVNSAFTADRYGEEFPGLAAPRVVYPGVDTAAYSGIGAVEEGAVEERPEIVLLSVNRFRAAKAIDRAIDALAALRERLPEELWARLRLALVGGYDETAPDAASTAAALKEQAARAGVEGRIEWDFNPTEAERLAWLARSRCLLYTPSDEHFGLGPIEAMAAARPVVAMDSGGPRETVVDGVTGRLTAPEAEAFAEAIRPYVEDADRARKHGLAGRERAIASFSLERFRDAMEEVLTELVER